jgi:hypothetical protein
MWMKLLLLLVLCYGAVVAAVFFAQTRMLFPVGMVSPAGSLPASAERLELLTPSGHRLHGMHIPAAMPRRDRLVILGFGGNAWNAEAAAVYLHNLYPEADVVAFHYRGYRPSEGRPSAAAHMADALLIHDAIQSRFGDSRLVAAGFSIGSGVATSLAARRPLDGLILVTPFDSLSAVAATHYPWLPVRLLLRHRMEPAADLRTVQTSVAIIAGERDTLIPAARTVALERAVPRLVFARTISGAGHNDIYQDPKFHAAMREALAHVLAR